MKRSKVSKSPSVQSPKSKNIKTTKKDVRSVVFTPENRNKECSQATRTSGGISKCLLTPCRRMGLTRNRLKPLNLLKKDVKSPLTAYQPPKETEESKSPVTSKLSKHKITSPILVDKTSDNVEINSTNKDIQEFNLLTPSPENLPQESVTKNFNEPLNLLKSCVVLVNQKVLPKNKRKLIKDIDSPQLDLVSQSPKLAKLKTKTMSSSSMVEGTSPQPKDKSLNIKIVKKNDQLEVVNVDSKSSSQNSSSSYQSDDDDNDFEEKTIIDRKAYKRSKLQINKPSKIKNSTSLQKEIDEIKARIALKQEQLNIQKTTSPKGPSEKELEELIHAWRDGCQRALEELLAISKDRGQLKSNMGMEDLLKMLHIPVDLVQYDPEQMTFV